MRPPLLVALLLASARALAPAALAREALVAYRASEENVAADKVLARALRGESSFTDADRRVAADVFLGTATRLRRYEWICAQRGLCGAASDATAVAAALLRARDEDDGAYTWPADADERLSATSGAPLWLCARWRRDLGEAVAAAVADQSTRRGPVTLRVRDDVSIGAVEEALAAAGVVTERPPAGVGAPRALTLVGGRPRGGVWALPGWSEGEFEVQDAGSQAIVEACSDGGGGGGGGGGGALDMCAGNGGKSLALAARAKELWCHASLDHSLKVLAPFLTGASDGALVPRRGRRPPRAAARSSEVCRAWRCGRHTIRTRA